MASSSTTTQSLLAPIPVWDAPVRLVHWTMALCFVALIVTGKLGWMQAHFYAGYGMGALLVFRVLWGLLGTRYARFSSFCLTPAAIGRSLVDTLRGRPTSYPGHNPAGAAMVLALLAVLGMQVASGLVYTDDVFWFGPLYFYAGEGIQKWAALLHPQLPLLLLILVALHVLAVLYHRLRCREPLVAAMLHGRKPWHDPAAAREPMGTARLLLALLPAVAFFVWLAVITV